MASGDAVQQIKERLSILDVISPYVELHKAGKSFKGKSPFTSEKTPSFHVSPDRGMYYCFSSSQGGDMFTFIQAMEGVDFKGALKILAEKAGVELVPEDPKKRDERDTQYALIEEATKFFFDEREKREDIKKYIDTRGVEGNTIHAWRIGYAPDEWRALRMYLTEKKFTDMQMRKAGLIKDAERGKEPYDVFRDRVMFPISDSSGRVVAFSGRTMKSDDKTPKYVNSPEIELFQKSEILYGYDKAKESIRKFDFSLIVEGQFDVVLSHQAGYANAVAVSGTALTPHHVMLLERLSNRVVLALDSDRAGIAAMKRGSDIMLRRGMDVKVATIPDDKDPADIVREEGREALKKVIGSAVHVIEFFLEVYKKTTHDDRAYKLMVREEVLPLLAVMPNRIDREHFEGVIAEALATTQDSVHFEVERISAKEDKGTYKNTPINNNDGTQQPTNNTEIKKGRKKALLEFFPAIESLYEEEITTPVLKIVEEILDQSIEQVREQCNESTLSATIFMLETQFGNLSDREIKSDLVDKLNELRMVVAKEKVQALRSEIQEAERSGDVKVLEKHLNELKELQKLFSATPYTETVFTI